MIKTDNVIRSPRLNVRRQKKSLNLMKNRRWDLSVPLSEFDSPQKEVYLRVLQKLRDYFALAPVRERAKSHLPEDLSQLVGEEKNDVIMVLYHAGFRPAGVFYSSKWYPPRMSKH